MSINVLHLSDLHLEEFKPNDNPRIKSRFQEKNFEDKFFNSIQNSGLGIDYAIVTGDLANTGSYAEYNVVEKFLNKFPKELGIEKTRILICPGNHDINWRKSKKAFHNHAAASMNEGKEAPSEIDSYKYHKEKFEYFTNFYNKYYSDPSLVFNPSLSVYRHLNISIGDCEILFCMLNSCYRESHYFKNHYGYIDHESFEAFLKNSEESILKIAMLHHIPVVLNDTKSIRNWDDEIKYLCSRYNVRVFLFGHQHKSQGSKIKRNDNEFIQMSVGTLGKSDIGVQNTFI